MKKMILFLYPFLMLNALHADYWDYEHVPLDELIKLENADVYYDGRLAIFIKYKDHWYEVENNAHHTLCPCPPPNKDLIFDLKKNLTEELGGH